MIPVRIRQAIRRHALLSPGDAIVVAVSGGPDSVALALGLAQLAPREGWKLHVAHLHHGIRGAEADADEELVRSLARRIGAPLSVSRLDPAYLRGTALEARARRARYEFLHEVGRQVGASRIATGHTRDDQAETVLLRLLRGSGARGLGAIRPAREDGVVRPLLLASRAEVIEFLGRRGVAWRDDSSNRDPRHLRNRVRHEVLPLLRALSPRIDERLAALADALRADAHWLDACAARARRDVGSAAGQPLDGDWLRELPEPLRRRVLGEALKEAGTPADRLCGPILAILDALGDEAPPRRIALRGGRWARVSREGVLLETREPPRQAPPFDLPLRVPGVTPLPDGRFIEAVRTEGGAPVDAPGAWRACFDAEAIEGALRVRSRRPGDRIRPRGFGRTRKVKDLLSEARVPREERGRVPIVVMGETILWIAGLRCAQAAEPRGGPRLVLTLRGGRPVPGT